MPPPESSAVVARPPTDAPTQIIGSSGFPHKHAEQHPEPTVWPRVRGYEVLSVIGTGGMGIVYKGRHRDLRRTVALKMLRGAAVADPGFHERFLAEAEAVARLQHPNIIQVFEIGTAESRPGDVYSHPFIALEYVNGGSLLRLTDAPQPPSAAAVMIEKLARAVHSAHRLGVVHRDLKPANVLLTLEGEPKIADFGLAKQLGGHDARGRCLTQAGMVVGTPEYMAPEQAMGEPPTPAIDIYALGVLLYELLTARVPFHASSAIETMALLQRGEPIPPREFQPSLPRDLETICLKCLEKDPAKRYATAADLADDLRCFLDRKPIRARRITEAEKVARWCRRNPLVAGSLTGILATFAVAFVLVTESYWESQAAYQQEAIQRKVAEEQRKEAEEQKKVAEKKEKDGRWQRYRVNILAAGAALQIHNVVSARNTLAEAPEEHRNWEWRHFESRLDLSTRVLQSTDFVYHGGAIALNGSRWLECGPSGLLRVWDTYDERIVRTIQGPADLQLAELSPNGRLICYTTADDAFEIHDVLGDRTLKIRHGHSTRPFSLHFCDDSSRLFTESDDAKVRIWEVATGRNLFTLTPEPAGHGWTGLSPNGRLLVTSDSLRKAVRIWDLDSGQQVASLPIHENGLQGIYFSPASDRIVTVNGMAKNQVRMWDAKTGQLMNVIGRHQNKVMAAAFNADGSRFATASMDETIILADGAGKTLRQLKGHTGKVNALIFSPDGKRLLSGSQDQTVRIWDTELGEPLVVLTGHSNEVMRVNYTSDGRRIISTSDDGVTRFWDPIAAETAGILRGHHEYVYSVAYHPDNAKNLVASSGWDGQVILWDVKEEKVIARLDHGPFEPIASSVAFHPNGRLFASRTRESVRLWDLATRTVVHRWDLPIQTWKDTRLAFNSTGELLATGGPNGQVHLFNVATRAEIAVLIGHKDAIRDVAFSPDGRWLASSGEIGDKTIRIWDLHTHQCVQILNEHLKEHSHFVYSLAFHPTLNLLVSGSLDGTVCVWDTTTWQKKTSLVHNAIPHGLAFSPDGTRLATACTGNALHLWDVDTFQRVAELRGHDAYLHSVAFSPDGSRIVTASGDHTVRIWDTMRPQDRVKQP